MRIRERRVSIVFRNTIAASKTIKIMLDLALACLTSILLSFKNLTLIQPNPLPQGKKKEAFFVMCRRVYLKGGPLGLGACFFTNQITDLHICVYPICLEAHTIWTCLLFLCVCLSMWDPINKLVRSWSVFVFHCCVTNYHKHSSLKQHTLIIFPRVRSLSTAQLGALQRLQSGYDWAVFLPAVLPNSRRHWQNSEFISLRCRPEIPAFFAGCQLEANLGSWRQAPAIQPSPNIVAHFFKASGRLSQSSQLRQSQIM